MAIAIEAAIVFSWRNQPAAAAAFASFTIGAFADGVVIAIARASIDEAPLGSAFARILERSWAVLVVNFIVSYLVGYGVQALTEGDIVYRIIAIPILLIAISLIFSEVVAVVIDDERWWMLIPHALGGSARVAWTGSMLWVALGLFSLQILPSLFEAGLAALLTKAHVAQAAFWSTLPVDIIWAIPINVLTTVVFLNAIGYEPKRPCSE